MSFWKTGGENKEKTEKPAPSRTEFQDEVNDLTNTLQECCSKQVGVGIIQADSNLICQGKFARVSNSSVIFETYAPEEIQFFPLSTCMVSYFREGKAHAFISLVRESHPGRDKHSQRLFLRLPEQIAVSQVRWTFRVPTTGIPGFDVKLHCAKGDVYTPEPRDVSFGGMKVEFDKDGDPDLCLGGKGKLSMSYEGNSVSLEAEVRRRDGHAYGLFFPGVFKNEEFSPPEAYREIVKDLERRWLQLRRED
ncbi:PilZ domain-containing protein [bacterium]|nr:PilZ domain-containing protein [bacterium]